MNGSPCKSVRMVQLSINKKLKVWKQVKEPLEISSTGAEFRNTFFQRSYVWGRSNGRDSLRICKWFQQIKNLILGSVILKQQQTTSNNDSILTVLMGNKGYQHQYIFKSTLFKKYPDNDFTETFKKQRDKQ